MKRFVSILLVAMLIVTSMAVAAFAAEPGETVTIPVTVNGPVASCKVQVSGTDVLTIKNISGDGNTTVNLGKGIVVWSNATNVNSYTFYVEVYVAENVKDGYYPLIVSVLDAAKKVSAEEDTDGVADGWTSISTSAGGGVEIKNPPCDHTWDNGKVTKEATCTEDGVKTYTCTKCGETKTETIAATGHAWDNGKVTKEATCTEDGVKTYTCSKCGETKTEAIPASHSWETKWSYDEKHHWHECSKCDEIKDQEEHTMILVDAKEPTPEEDGYTLYECSVCDRQSAHKWEYGEEPKVGDIRPLMVLGFGAVLSMLAAAAYVCKRKNVI